MELIEQKPSTGKIAEALAAAQAEMSNPKFDKLNPHFRNKFASLAAVRDAVIPVLAKHGIACVQDLKTGEGLVSCTTTLLHGSGESMVFGPLTMPVTKPDAQGYGSAGTYSRRYHLMAVANVVGDEDDDANEATGKPAAAQQLKPGIGVHSPLGDVDPKDEHRAYADAIRESIGNPERIAEIHSDLHNEGEEFYRAVWSLLDSKTRSAFKKIMDQRKAA